MLEKLLGPRRFIILYGLSALGGGLASALLRSLGLAVGASGAIWGLMAAGVGLAIRPRGLLPPLRLERARRRSALPLGINFIYSFSPGIDLFAHFGGGLVGLVLMATGIITRGVSPVWTDGSDVAPQQRSSQSLTLGALAISIAMLGSVAVAFAVGRPWQIGEPPVLTRVQLADTRVALEIPSVIAGSPVEENKEGFRVFGFGNLASAPVMVELVVHVLPQAVPPDELDEVMQLERKGAQETNPAGAKRQGDAKIVTVGGRPFVTVTHLMNTVILRSWITVFGDREVVLRVYSAPDLPASWAGIEDTIVASLQAQNR